MHSFNLDPHLILGSLDLRESAPKRNLDRSTVYAQLTRVPNTNT